MDPTTRPLATHRCRASHDGMAVGAVPMPRFHGTALRPPTARSSERNRLTPSFALGTAARPANGYPASRQQGLLSNAFLPNRTFGKSGKKRKKRLQRDS